MHLKRPAQNEAIALFLKIKEALEKDKQGYFSISLNYTQSGPLDYMWLVNVDGTVFENEEDWEEYLLGLSTRLDSDGYK
jgi:hypothetical protein